MEEKKEPELLEPSALANTQRLAELGLMSAAVQHEIKQPLAAIKGYAYLIREKTDGTLSERAAGILAQVERIEQLLASQRRYLSPAAPRRARVDLRHVAAQAARVLEPRAHQIGAQIGVKTPAEPVEVSAIEGHVLQVVGNLVANALDAVAGGEHRAVEIHVRSDARTREVLVADTGAGVPAHVEPSLFKPLFTTKAAEAGNGLGLYISRALAEANDAELDHIPASGVGLGTRTVFRLRFALPPPSAERPAVLIVDDEEVVCAMLGSLLEDEPLELTFAASGDQAIAVMQKRRFDLLLCDKNLPGASGLDVARAARASNPGCRILLMTGYPSVETAQEALSLGVYDYLEKPFDDIGAVRQRVRDALAPRPELAPPQPPRRVLIVEDRREDALRLGEAVAAAGGLPLIAASVAEAFARVDGASGVLLSLELKDEGLTPDAVRALRRGAHGALVALCDRPSLEQTIAAIRMGASACLPRAFASPNALSRELARFFALGSAGR
jgi:CheY-like chemotaxis protein